MQNNALKGVSRNLNREGEDKKGPKAYIAQFYQHVQKET